MKWLPLLFCSIILCACNQTAPETNYQALEDRLIPQYLRYFSLEETLNGNSKAYALSFPTDSLFYCKRADFVQSYLDSLQQLPELNMAYQQKCAKWIGKLQKAQKSNKYKNCTQVFPIDIQAHLEQIRLDTSLNATQALNIIHQKLLAYPTHLTSIKTNIDTRNALNAKISDFEAFYFYLTQTLTKVVKETDNTNKDTLLASIEKNRLAVKDFLGFAHSQLRNQATPIAAK